MPTGFEDGRAPRPIFNFDFERSHLASREGQPELAGATISRKSLQLKTKIWKQARSLKIGIVICPYGRQTNFAGEGKIGGHFEVPVQWQKQRASMSFYGTGSNVRFNPIATRLLNHPHLRIRGSAYNVTNIEERYKMQAWATHQDVTGAIANLGLSTPSIIVDIGVRVPQQDIYAATENDLFAIRMYL